VGYQNKTTLLLKFTVNEGINTEKPPNVQNAIFPTEEAIIK
jgi:hypothetical protein